MGEEPNVLSCAQNCSVTAYLNQASQACILGRLTNKSHHQISKPYISYI